MASTGGFAQSAWAIWHETAVAPPGVSDRRGVGEEVGGTETKEEHHTGDLGSVQEVAGGFRDVSWENIRVKAIFLNEYLLKKKNV